MALLRRVLVPATMIWLLCQLGTVALVPVVLLMSATESEAAECDCGHGPGAMCPMHKNKKPSRPSAPCAMQAANSFGDALLTALAGTAGPIIAPTTSIQPPVPTARPRAADVHLAGERPVPPDPPPPRA